MFRTIAALALSMTMGAILLASIEPRPAISDPGSNVLLRGQPSQSLTSPGHHTWSKLWILCNPVSNSADALSDRSASRAQLILDVRGAWHVHAGNDASLDDSEATSDLVLLIEAPRDAMALSYHQLDSLELLFRKLQPHVPLSLDQVGFVSHHPGIPDLRLQFVPLLCQPELLTFRE